MNKGMSNGIKYIFTKPEKIKGFKDKQIGTIVWSETSEVLLSSGEKHHLCDFVNSSSRCGFNANAAGQLNHGNVKFSFSSVMIPPPRLTTSKKSQADRVKPAG